MTKRVAFRHRKTGEVHVTTHADHYADRKVWEPVDVPAQPRLSDEDKRRRRIAAMNSVERYDDLVQQIAALRERLDKAGQ